MTVNSSLTVNTADILVEDGAIMRVNTGSVTNADILQINAAGQLIGCGTINAIILNYGNVTVDCGTSPGLVVTEEVTNDGDFVLVNDSYLTATTTTFTNNGTLDLRDGDQTLPTFLVNNGTILLTDGLLAEIVNFDFNGDDVVVTADTSASYSYHMEYSDDLGTWTDCTTPVPGGGTLDFTHTNGKQGVTKRFYRLVEE